MVHICDAIMGSGKSQSAIAYMNEHPDQRFIYIAVYLDEVERIKNSCPEAGFVEPSDKIGRVGYSKVLHTAELLKQGRNIVTTHAAFRLYEAEMIENIRRHGYVLIMDEVVNIMDEYKDSAEDLMILREAGYIEDVGNGRFVRTEKPYNGEVFKSLLYMFDRNAVIELADGASDGAVLFWQMTPEVIQAFRDVYVLTYLFEGQDLKYFLDMNRIPYDYIGVSRAGGGFHFCESREYVPGYVSRLSRMIHIFDNEKLNAIGNDRYALSSSWSQRNASCGFEKLKSNLYNYMVNYHRRASTSDRMWSCFERNRMKLRGNGYSKGFVPCNMRASNNYRDKNVLAYCLNIFQNPYKKRYLQGINGMYDEDTYALSTMIQWIWRSAIRDGGEIDVYVPSRRMRELLEKWIASVEAEAKCKGDDHNECSD